MRKHIIKSTDRSLLVGFCLALQVQEDCSLDQPIAKEPDENGDYIAHLSDNDGPDKDEPPNQIARVTEEGVECLGTF